MRKLGGLVAALSLLGGVFGGVFIGTVLASRNSSGTYSLPAGNPVTTGTTITSTWANTTLSDLGTEVTDSLNRSGKGAMLAPLQLSNGTALLPSLTFGTDPNTGLYRIGADNMGLTCNGAKVVDISTGGVAVTGTLSSSGVASFSDGTKTAPGVAFTSDPDTGLYRIGANNPAMSAGDTKVQDWTTTGTTVTGTVTATNTLTLAKTSDTNIIELGTGIAQAAFVDFGGSASTYSDYALRITRDTGDNGNSEVRTRGTGSLSMGTNEAGALNLFTTGSTRLGIAAGGAVTISAPSTANANGLTVTGSGTEHGISATGGGSSGFGGLFQGGATNGRGITVTGAGTGVGIVATGGSTANGINTTGGSGGATAGIEATGGPGGNGGYFANGTAASGGTRRDALALTNGDLDVSGVADATSTTSISDRLTPSNIVKVWGKITTNGASGYTVDSGFNIASVTANAGQLAITIAADFSGADNYAAVATPNGTTDRRCAVANTAAGQLDVHCWTAAGAVVNWETTAMTVSVIAIGLQ